MYKKVLGLAFVLGMLVLAAPALADVGPTTNAATNITTSDATLNGTVGSSDVDNTGFWVATSSFSTADPSTVPDGVYSTGALAGTTTGATFSAQLGSITGLLPITPSTTYYFTAWTNIGGTWTPGAQLNFSTLPTPPAPCTSGVGSSLLVDHTQTISNDPDSANGGGNWALDNFTRHIQIWQEGGTYCAQATDSGSFTSFGGASGISPQSRAALPEIVTGTFNGGTHGAITGGTLNAANNPADVNCSADPASAAICSNGLTSYWVSSYFGGSGSYDYGARSDGWSWTYGGGANGTWVNANSGNTGDILHVPNSTVYVDGTNGSDLNDGSQAHPFLTIQAAVNAVTAGGTVNVLAGTYTENVVINKSLMLEGANAGVTATSTSRNPESVIDGSGSANITVNSDNVTIDGFRLLGPSDQGTAALVMPGGNSGETIQNNIIEDAGRAVSFNTNSTTFLHNMINESAATGDGIQQNSGHVHDLTISGNVFSGGSNNNADITVISDSTGSSNIHITNNISTTPRTLVALFNTDTAEVTGNTVTGATGSAIYIGGNVSHVTVSGNTVTGGSATAIKVANSFGDGPNSTVTLVHNTLQNNAFGIVVNDTALSDTLIANNNTISGNTTADVQNNSTTATADATLNFWNTGTTSPASKIGGTGTVNFSPWYADAAMTQLVYTTTASSTASTTSATTGSSDTTLMGTSTTDGSVNVTVVIPPNTTITGDSTWDGTISPPTATTQTVTISGFNTTVTSAVTIGSSESDLTFDNAVKITFAGQTGTHVGWYNHAGTFTEITDTCADNTQGTNNTNLAAGGSCKFDTGTDMVVWTKHFSTFVTYTQTAVVSSGGGSGGGNGGGGGGGGGGPVGLFGSTNGGGSVIPTGNGGGEVLGAAAYNFATDLTIGSTGPDVVELQKELIAMGFDIPLITQSGVAYGYFGAQTRAAVAAYQTAHGITPAVGYFGPITRESFKQGSTASTGSHSNLTVQQKQSILNLLSSFGADQTTINNVNAAL